MSIVSDLISLVGLPPSNAGTLVGVNAIASGFGRTTQGKCVDPFNSSSTDKEWLLYSQCRMDLMEVTQKYVIWNTKVTPFNAIQVWAFCIHCI